MLAISSRAQEPAAPVAPVAATAPAPEFLKQETIITLGAAVKEVQAALAKQRTPGKRLDSYTTFQFSSELQPKLKEIFGTERPFPMERVPGGAKGQVNYVAKLAPYTYKQDNGTDFTWTELVSKTSVDKSGRTLNTSVAWPSLVVSRVGGSFSMLDMSMTSKQVTGADNVGYGNAIVKIGSVVVRDMSVAGADAREAIRFEDIEAKSAVRRRGAMAEIAYSSSIKAIVFGNDWVERSNFAFRLTNVPAKALADMDQQWRALQDRKLEPADQHKQIMKTLQDFGKRIAIAGATLFIDDISVGYRGNVASLKGRIGFQKVAEADFKDLTALLKKVVARFEVRVPVALVHDVSRTFAVKAVNPSAPDAAKQIDTATEALSSMVVGKTVSGGYGVVEKNELRTLIEFKGGTLLVNGKVIDIGEQLKTLSKLAQGQAGPVPAPVPVPVPVPAQ